MTANEGHFTGPVAQSVTWIKLSVILTSLEVILIFLDVIHRCPLVSLNINSAQSDGFPSLCLPPPIKAITNKPSFKDRERKALKTLHTETSWQQNSSTRARNSLTRPSPRSQGPHRAAPNMCVTTRHDVLCHQTGCQTIIQFKAKEKYEWCPTATNGNKGYGGCGSLIKTDSEDPVRAENSICDGCKERVLREHNERYDNAPQYIDDLRERQQKRDHEGHVRRGELPVRSGTPMPQAQAASQQVYGAGTQWSADPGGYMYGGQGDMFSFGDPREYFNLGTGVSSFPQTLDFEDPGEGPSGSSDYEYNQGYGEGHDQQGGQGSGSRSRR